jgi:hypothetical protein
MTAASTTEACITSRTWKDHFDFIIRQPGSDCRLLEDCLLVLLACTLTMVSSLVCWQGCTSQGRTAR